MNRYGIDYNKLNQKGLNDVFGRFCLAEDLNEIKYLLTSPDLKNRPDIHFNKDESFGQLINDENLEIIQYLIFEHNIEKTKDIVNQLGSWPNDFKQEVEKLFTIRDFKNSLDTDLPFSDSKAKKVKI
jgi:hypothetical protein